MQNWKAKLRARRTPQGRHGKVKRILGNTPNMTFHDALMETLKLELEQYCREHPELEEDLKIVFKELGGKGWGMPKKT